MQMLRDEIGNEVIKVANTAIDNEIANIMSVHNLSKIERVQNFIKDAMSSSNKDWTFAIANYLRERTDVQEIYVKLGFNPIQNGNELMNREIHAWSMLFAIERGVITELKLHNNRLQELNLEKSTIRSLDIGKKNESPILNHRN
jgi:hypothetical protein